MIDPKDVAVVVHTCTARINKLEPLMRSIEESDIEHHQTEWAVEPHGACNWEKRLHYLSLLCRNARKAPYVLRLEDDIIVNRHILHNLCTWPALEDDRFGMGLAFVNQILYELPHSRDNVQHAHHSEWGMFRDPSSTPWAQAHFFKSEHLIPAAQCYFEELAEKNPKYYAQLDKVALAFDWAITKAMGRMGLRVYLHQPSLAQGTEMGDVRALSGQRVPNPHRASDFDPDWKRHG